MKPPKRKCLSKQEGCEVEYIRFNSFQPPVCGNLECKVQWSIKQVEKKKQKERTKLAREKKTAKDRLKTRNDWIKEAQTVFNAYIRERDKDLPCISCGRHHSGQYHAGHFCTTKARPDLRFCEVQVRKQCAPCNNHLSGNIPLYRQSLITIIGEKWVDQIENGLRGSTDWTVEEIKEIKRHYQQELKRIKNI